MVRFSEKRTGLLYFVPMIFREAQITDVDAIMDVRMSVLENILSDPSLVSADDCIEYIEQRGRGWVCEIGLQIVGFAIVDLVERNVWALFVHPDFEKQGIGRQLHQMMLDWYR